MENKKFPQYLHKPYQIGPLNIEQIYILLIFLILGLIGTKLFLIGVVLGPLLYFRASKKYPRGFLFIFFYAIGLQKFKGYPDFFEQKFNE